MSALEPDPASLAAIRPTRLWLFDDHQVFVQLLAEFLQGETALTLVGSEIRFDALQAAMDRREVDLVLLDLNLRGEGGLHLLKRIKAHPFAPSVLILSSHASLHSVQFALANGADGYVQKTSPLTELVEAIGTVRRGGRYLGSGLPRQLSEVGPGDASGLLLEDLDLLARLAEGEKIADVAKALGVSRFHLYRKRVQLMQRIGASRDKDLLAFAIQAGMRPANRPDSAP